MADQALLRRVVRRLNLGAVEQARNLYESMMLSCIEVQNDPLPGAFREIQKIAHKYPLTAYNAAYLFMANHHRLPLATLHAPLIAAAKKSGVGVLR